MALFKFAGVLRARVAQENAAKAEVARSQVTANAAMAEVHRQSATLDQAEKADYSTANALAVAMATRQAMAAELAFAVGTAEEAEVIVENRKADLAAAARQRKAMEKLAERHAITRRHKADVAERAEVDDITNARYTQSQRNQRKDLH
jgi:flagellar export protein FliJ